MDMSSMSLIKPDLQSILYENADRSVILIDVPLSIALSQGTRENPCKDLLYSETPLEKPHPSTEPRSEKARQKVQERNLAGGLAQSPIWRDWLLSGLEEIRASHASRFCLERPRKPSADVHDQGHETESEASGLWEEQTGTRYREMPLKVKRPGGRRAIELQAPLILPPSALSSNYETARVADAICRIISNPFPRTARIQFSDDARSYRVPPFASFMLSKVNYREATYFSKAAVKAFPEPSVSAAPGQFDLIVLDPPWANRSARRSKMYKTRQGAEENPLEVLQEILGKHIAPEAIVACWITNKSNVQETALQLYESWGVQLTEEWTWLKTTVDGEPICEIDGIVRRPYETLFLGKLIDGTVSGDDDLTSNQVVRKRLIVGVPDIHSRKPCLKPLIEPLMPDSSNYRALEIFARNLTAGWWSWGDEVLKYNWEGCWTQPKD
ncbi:MAG: hypothetical protein Q9220_002791 [cf. Caloplaca sp. 1 TL-2023]